MKYDDEFKRQTVQKVLDSQSVRSVSRELGVTESQIHKWRRVRCGNCYDNAQAESFFSRFKAELIEGGVFEDIEHARSEVFSYIEGYNNRIRLHSSLGYLSPIEYELDLKTKNQGKIESFLSTFS